MCSNSNDRNGSIKLHSVPFEEILKSLEDSFIDCPDVVMRRSTLKNDNDCYFIYLDDLIDEVRFERNFMVPILELEIDELRDIKKLRTLPVANINFNYDINESINEIITGGIVFMYDGMSFAISCKLEKIEKRSIEEPETEKNVRGAHDGFIELTKTNMSLLRKRIKSKNLKFKTFQLGETTHQTITIAYIGGIANADILQELVSRIKKINIDGVVSTGYIEQLITDNPNSPFPQFLATERPDKVMASLLEGRFAVNVEGSPVMVIAPVTYFSFFQAPDDYNTHWLSGTFLGILREFAMIIAVFLPALYIAITAFHYYIVPLRLLIPLAESRERVPFPPFIEAMIMELTIEFLREASIRLPTYIGTSIGVIGGIIIGQAAVQAGIVSVLMIIVVAVTAIASYTTPIYDMGFAIRIYRFLAMVAASILGVVGILISAILLIEHLISLESLGQPYFQPIIPMRIKGLKNTFMRLPYKYMKARPTETQPLDEKRGKKQHGRENT